ncbi:helix-turn-helix domain-containing protein [Streptomyces sp. NPDC058417]|uniref:helix-turn-helix domain-containing protein n=1 Tax=unclassified Streptomyces TaxID=2593676 RepID=UPI0036577326
MSARQSIDGANGCIAPLPPAVRAERERLLRGGHGDLDTAAQAGVARSTVYRTRRALGIPAPPPRAAARRTSCRRGHPYPAQQDPQRKRWCRVCERARRKRTRLPVEPDQAAIERAVSGDHPVHLTPRERHAAIRRLLRQGLSAAQIAERVGCTERTVYRAKRRVVTA